MKRLEPEIIDYYNNEVIMMIAEKYGFSQMEALKAFVNSKTHEMLENEECDLLEYYAAYKNKKTGDVLKEWEEHGITKKYTITIGYIIPSASKMPIWISTA